MPHRTRHILAVLGAGLLAACSTHSATYYSFGNGALSIDYEHGPLRIGSCGFYRAGESYHLRFGDSSGRYTNANMTILLGDTPLNSFTGTVTVDAQSRLIVVALSTLDSAGRLRPLPINGRYRIDVEAERANAAKERLRVVLEGMSGRAPYGMRPVIATWYRGTILLRDEAMWQDATDSFSAWRKEGHIQGHIADFSITGAELQLRPAESPVVVVAVVIDGIPHKVAVTDGVPLQWR